jgi:hypothetical protein
MDYKSYTFSAKDTKIRKRWLNLTIFTHLLLPSIIVFVGIFASTIYHSFSLIIGIPIFAILVFLSFYTLLHCAYRKLGTRYLTFCIILGIINTIRDAGKTIASSDLQTLPANKYLFLLEAVAIAISIYWYVLSFQLRKMNKKIRLREKRSMEASEDYKNIISTIQTASSTEDLNRIISELFQQWPNYKPMISEAYEEKKEALESQPS